LVWIDKLLLNYGHGAKDAQLGARLWSTDRGANLDSRDPDTEDNLGLKWRHTITRESTIFDMESSLNEDIFSLKKYLLNSVDLNLRLYRSKPEFYLMSSEEPADFHFEIMEIVFRACRVTVSNAVLIAHNQALTKEPAMYAFKRTYCKMATISPGK
jgi:hypothetical protein